MSSRFVSLLFILRRSVSSCLWRARLWCFDKSVDVPGKACRWRIDCSDHGGRGLCCVAFELKEMAGVLAHAWFSRGGT